MYCSFCGKSYNKWCSFKKHLHYDHGKDNEATKLCMYICIHRHLVASNSTSVDYDHDPNSDHQEVPIDDYLDESQ